MNSNEDTSFKERYSKELGKNYASLIINRNNPESSSKFFKLEESNNEYSEGKPFVIEVSPKNFSHLKSETSQSKHYSNNSSQFDVQDSAYVKGLMKEGQHQSIDIDRPYYHPSGTQQPSYATSHEILTQINKDAPKLSVKIKKVQENDGFKKQRIDKTHSKSPIKKPYVKMPFHGLFFKRHIKNSSLSQCSASQQKHEGSKGSKDSKDQKHISRYGPVSKPLVKQILEMEIDAIEQLKEDVIERINEILAERLDKSKEHYEEQLKQRCYIEINQLMRQTVINKKIIGQQRMHISHIRDDIVRQSSQYGQAVHQSIIQIKQTIHKQTMSIRKLAAQVQLKEQNEKKSEKRGYMQEQTTEMSWQCVTMHKDNATKHARESAVVKKIHLLNKRLSEAQERLKDLESEMLNIVSNYYQLHPEKKTLLQKITMPCHISNQRLSDCSPIEKSLALENRSRNSSSQKLVNQNLYLGLKKGNLQRTTRAHKNINKNVANAKQINEHIQNQSFSRQIPNNETQSFSQSLPIEEVNRNIVKDNQQKNSQYKVSKWAQAVLNETNQRDITSEKNKQLQKNVEILSVKDHLEGDMVRPFSIRRRSKPNGLENPETIAKSTQNQMNNPISKLMLGVNKAKISRYSTQGSDVTQSYCIDNMSFTDSHTHLKNTLDPKVELGRTKHRIRSLKANTIESIMEVDEPQPISSLSHTKQFINRPQQSTLVIQTSIEHEKPNRHFRKLKLRSGTETDKATKIQPTSLRSAQLPSYSFMRLNQLTLEQSRIF